MQSNIECAIYAANTRILRILFIIKCIFDMEVTFVTLLLMFVIDVQADIFSMQYASIFAIFAYLQRIYSTFNVGLHYTLHSSYFSAQLLMNSAQMQSALSSFSVCWRFIIKCGRCPRKFGPPKIWPPRAKFPRKFGPLGAIFPRKYGLPFGNLAPSKR